MKFSSLSSITLVLVKIFNIWLHVWNRCKMWPEKSSKAPELHLNGIILNAFLFTPILFFNAARLVELLIQGTKIRYTFPGPSHLSVDEAHRKARSSSTRPNCYVHMKISQTTDHSYRSSEVIKDHALRKMCLRNIPKGCPLFCQR